MAQVDATRQELAAGIARVPNCLVNSILMQAFGKYGDQASGDIVNRHADMTRALHLEAYSRWRIEWVRFILLAGIDDERVRTTPVTRSLPR